MRLGTVSWADPGLIKTKRFYPKDVSQPKPIRGSAQAKRIA
ncbi:hypothetical protein LG3211_0319 [Lysobacter gummosus]|nr:hypothetical protein LG3211_0319 [Lysobacter gummosus]